MQGHRGLPSKLPANRARAKIFSPGTSPSKNSVSPVSTYRRQSHLQTPEKSNSPGRSRHLLKSKQKPLNNTQTLSIGNSRLAAGQTRVTKFQLTDDKASQQAVNGEFLQNMLSMVNKIGSIKQTEASQEARSNLPSSRKGKLVVLNKKLQNNTNQAPQTTYEIRHIQYSSQPVSFYSSKVTDQELAEAAARQMVNQDDWLSYRGQLVNGTRQGYGILQFKNGDKFMGAFRAGLACDHGTYYGHSAGRKILGVWREGILSDDFIIQNL